MNKTSLQGFTNLLFSNTFKFRAMRFLSPLISGGKNYHCIACHSFLDGFVEAGHAHDSLKKHEVIGGGIRKNARCPECNSVDRERLVLLYLVYETKLFQNRHYVLHVAPELYIRKFLSLRKSLDYLTCDLMRRDVDDQQDLTQLSYQDESFDAIM